jgi:hypothetical protein
MFGLMAVLGSSKFPNHFTLSLGTQRLQGDVACCGLFFRTSHGKGKHNGACVVVKRMLWAQQLNAHGHLMQNVEDVVNFLQATIIGQALCSYPIVVSDSLLKKVFWHVKVGDVDCDNEWAIKTLTCIQKLHCVASCFVRDPTKLHIKNLAFCLDEDYENYISSHHVGDWRIHLLVPTNLTYIQSLAEATNDEDGWEHGGNGKNIVQSLEIGDNFVVNATPSNEEGCEFYVATRNLSLKLV